MKVFIFVLVAVVYLIGLWTVKWLDKVFEVNKSKYHFWVLLIMWIFTPVILIAFIIDFTFRFTKKTLSK